LLIQEERWAGAVDALQEMIEVCPNHSQVWDVYRMLAVSHYYNLESEKALRAAEVALQLAPSNHVTTVQQLIAVIQQQPVPPEPASAAPEEAP
jgi:hypothetical protein